MNWEDLKIFLALAEEGSVRDAAHKLQVSHSTVSRRVDSFEQSLGVRLFDRQRDGFKLTGVGENLAETAREIRGQITETERHVMGMDNQLKGELVVTMPRGLLTHLLMPHMQKFREEYPKIQLTFVTTNDFLSLSRREADVAIRLTDNQAENVPQHLVGRRLPDFKCAVYASEAYVKEHDMDDPVDASWVGWEHRVNFPRWRQKTEFSHLPVRWEFDDMVLQLEAARNGLGIALVPCFLGDRDPGVVRISKEPIDVFEGWIITHGDLIKTERVKIFIQFVADAIKEYKDLLEGKEGSSPRADKKSGKTSKSA